MVVCQGNELICHSQMFTFSQPSAQGAGRGSLSGNPVGETQPCLLAQIDCIHVVSNNKLNHVLFSWLGDIFPSV